MDNEPNHAFDHARRVSDYFAMALRVGIGSGAAFGLWQLAISHPETAELNRFIAVIAGICTGYLAIAFLVAVVFDLRSIRHRIGRRETFWFDLAGALVALGLLVSLIYFARTTAVMMM